MSILVKNLSTQRQGIQMHTWIKVAIVTMSYIDRLNKPEWASMERGIQVEKEVGESSIRYNEKYEGVALHTEHYCLSQI